jgi:hypothetical protein
MTLRSLQTDLARMLAIAESLRREIPSVSAQAARPMIDAAAELQQIADRVSAHLKREEEAMKRLAEELARPFCPCPTCTARRESAGRPASGTLN